LRLRNHQEGEGTLEATKLRRHTQGAIDDKIAARSNQRSGATRDQVGRSSTPQSTKVQEGRSRKEGKATGRLLGLE